MSGKTAVIASMGFGKGPNKLSDYAKSNVAHGHSISGGVGQKQIAKVRKRVTSDSIHQTRNNAQNTQEDSVSPVRHIQKGSMRIDSAQRKLPTDGDLPLYPAIGAVGKTSAKTFGLGENQGTFTGLYQNDLSAQSYQRRIGTFDKQN